MNTNGINDSFLIFSTALLVVVIVFAYLITRSKRKIPVDPDEKRQQSFTQSTWDTHYH